MKSFMKTSSLIMILLIGINYVYSQEDTNNKEVNSNNIEELGLKKNLVYGSLGIGFMNFTSSIYYERIYGKGIKSLNAQTFFRVGSMSGIGLNSSGEEINGGALLFDAGFLFAYSSNSYLELVLGLRVNKSENTDFFPIGGSLTYRFQKTQGYFVFRTGVGYPEALFVSIGFCF